MRALANAKVNLALRIGSVRPDGFHPLHGLFQSISLSDRLELETGGPDGIAGWRGEEVPDGAANLAWRAVLAVRNEVGGGPPLRLRLEKRIPAAAGLGGGSSDAAAALQLAGRLLGAVPGQLAPLAAHLGSDVPFCTVGGTAVVTGRGDVVAPLPPLLGYGLALVVPPFELATAAVYRQWDAMGEPDGPDVGVVGLPPALRGHAPLINDLYPAAVAVAGELDDWRRELETAWGCPVRMTGSGPTLFAFFADVEETEAALAVVPAGARATHAAVPVATGWAIQDR